MARIEGYTFGRAVVDGNEETRDLIVLPHRVVRNWWRLGGHTLVIADLEHVLDELPERLVVGRPAPRVGCAPASGRSSSSGSAGPRSRSS